MSNLRLILIPWPLWALAGAAIGFFLSLGTVDVHDGAEEDERILKVVVCGLPIHEESSTSDGVWPRERIWRTATIATLIVLGAAAAIALRAILHKLSSATSPNQAPAPLPEPTPIFEAIRALLGVALMSFLVVTMGSALHSLLYPDFHPPRAFALTLIAIPPIVLIAIAIAERIPSFYPVVRRIGQGVAVLYLLVGAIAGLAMLLAIVD